MCKKRVSPSSEQTAERIRVHGVCVLAGPVAMGALDDVQLGTIPESRYSDVIQHLRNSFFADEPLNSAVQLCRPGEPHAELEDHSLTTLADGLSQMAVHATTGEVSLCTLPLAR
ncbi:hypothetical protein PR048_028462 [Dryococelus australis]|uniref:Uncharacterized protein n=1 Tax=Dryococelus australis TaxID=614101 RepID=A0ABQ9GD68_9NEOP|nr:hypothetical protein PR048_028462 [Dryococelus australis]